MIDIHHHCLPGVDDGPDSIEEAAEMCSIAASEGIETIVATPHVLRGRWPAFTLQELAAKLRALQVRTGNTPKLLLGSEYFFAHDMCDVLQAGESIAPLAGSRYVLLELPANGVPPMIEQPLYRAQLEGWTPILAHPERNLMLQARPELLRSLVEHGLKTQLTAGSLVGEFGKKAQAAAETFLEAGLIHFLATDAHNTTKRPPRVSAAIRRLRELVGDEIADQLTRHNPAAVVAGAGLPWDPEPGEEVNHGLFTRVRRFFGAT
ncbi:MAG TPA: CpsB/CapC family capsule biosynthesis tyrosine phosphatase [Thermoanaerobaculia bacterium]